MTDDGRTIAERLADAEPGAPARLDGLIDRLTAGGRLRGARLDGRAIGPRGLAAVEVRGVTDDSREVRPGALFVAIDGGHVDGHEFVARAAEAGAAAAIVERPLPEVALPQLIVDRSQPAVAVAASWWYGDPSRELAVVGITGTDGKTTTSFLATAALEAAGIRTGMIGTASTPHRRDRRSRTRSTRRPRARPSCRPRSGRWPPAGTAPRSSRPRRTGSRSIASAAIGYDVAILTNLSHEHLEFHGSWDAYRRRQAAPCSSGSAGSRPAVPSPRASAGRGPGSSTPTTPLAGRFIGVTQEAGARVLSYGTDPSADVRATRIEEDARGLRVAYEAPSGPGTLGAAARRAVQRPQRARGRRPR